MESKSTIATIKMMNQDLVRLDRFDGANFTRWQDKLKFLLTALKIFYVLDSKLEPIPDATDKDTEEIRIERKKREEDELICCGHILNALSDRLHDLYTNTTSAKEICYALESKYKAEEEDNIPLLSQVHELQIIVNKLKVIKIELPETFQVEAIIAKLPDSWRGYRKKILHNSEDFSLEDIHKHLCIEEKSRARDKIENSYDSSSKVNSVDNVDNSNKHRKQHKKEGQVNSVDEIIATMSEINAIQGKVSGWWYDTCATIH
ncbi:uncharacterized protein LOC111392157, partial [Olea europaea var. sylvestris]|uniref:uncharacterized protein LOC111392157 n=1 Tax=Olea europaea var. sylvestris TaxID=158386 RepID=UPI000C1CCD1C